jgi:hypothetical protein
LNKPVEIIAADFSQVLPDGMPVRQIGADQVLKRLKGRDNSEIT